MKTKLDPDQEMEYLLSSAIEGGGSRYWCMIEDYTYPKGKTEADFEYPHLELPFKGGSIQMTADGEKKVYTLDRKALDRGWKLMITDEPHHYADAVTGSGDMITGDVFLQLCLFGKVIFG